MEQTDFTIEAGLHLRGQNIACARGGRQIFDGVTFTLTNGQILVITGANGSGKTSLLRVIAGLLPVTDGQLVWEGVNATQKHAVAPALCHFIADKNALKSQLQVRENLAFWARWFGAPQNITKLDELLQQVGLLEQAELLASDLSVGQAKRLALARLFIVPRALWLLDEPLAGLDEQGRAWLEEIAAAHLAQGGLICVATHEKFSLPSMPLSMSATILKLDAGAAGHA